MSRRRNILIATVPMMAALLLAGCEPGLASAPAAPAAPASSLRPPSAADIAYCNKLASLYEQYGDLQSRSGTEADVSVAEAMNQCQAGNPDGGIATLQRKLTEQRITLPPR